MLAFDLKRTPKLVLAKTLPKLAAECVDKYSDTPEFIEKLDGWRERMRSAGLTQTAGGAAECKQIMFDYAKLVSSAGHRLRGANVSAAKIKFEWRDSFLGQEPSLWVSEFAFERVAVLFNAAAALSFLATHEDRGTADGIKSACQSFQQAAGVLEAVMAECRSAAWTNLTMDLTSDCLEMLKTLMLAQAQKCFYEKAARDGIKDTTLALLAAECAALYRDTQLKLAPMRSRIEQGFQGIIEANASLFDGLQHYHAAPAHKEALEYGKELARLGQAVNGCAQAVDICRRNGVHDAVIQKFGESHARAADIYTKAKKDNDLIYTEKVPPVATLPPIARKLMVKPIEPPDLALPEMPTPVVVPVAPVAPPPAAPPTSNVPEGPTHTTEVKLYKPHATTKIGVTLTSHGMEAPACTALSPDGIAQTILKLGDVVLSINGTAGAGHEQTTSLLRNAIGEITILVQRKGEKPAAQPTAAAAPTPVTPDAPPKDASRGDPPPPSFEAALALESEALSQLVAMGFDKGKASEALKSTNGAVDQAAEMLVQATAAVALE